jgi:hypothetical protein
MCAWKTCEVIHTFFTRLPMTLSRPFPLDISAGLAMWPSASAQVIHACTQTSTGDLKIVAEIGRRTSFAMTCPIKKVFASDPDHPDRPRCERAFARSFVGDAQTSVLNNASCCEGKRCWVEALSGRWPLGLWPLRALAGRWDFRREMPLARPTRIL